MPPTGMNADQWRMPRPQRIHGIGILLRECEAKLLVGEERLLRIDDATMRILPLEWKGKILA